MVIRETGAVGKLRKKDNSMTIVVGKILGIKLGQSRKLAGYKLKPLGVVHEKRSAKAVPPAIHAAKA